MLRRAPLPDALDLIDRVVLVIDEL